MEVGLALDAVALIVGLQALVDGCSADAVDEGVALNAGGAGVVGVDHLAVQRYAEEALQGKAKDAGIAACYVAVDGAAVDRVADSISQEVSICAAIANRASWVNNGAVYDSD